MNKTAKEIDRVLGNWVDEHRRRRRTRAAARPEIDETRQDFVDVMLSSLDETKLPAHQIDTTIKATCLVRKSSLRTLRYCQLVDSFSLP